MAALTWEKNTRCTHPVSTPTVPRRRPWAGTRAGRGIIGPMGGRTDSIARRDAGRRSRTPERRRAAAKPVLW